MKYVVASTAVTDEIHFADGETVIKAAGGAGIYALSGIKLWSDEVILATGTGEDFKEIYGRWFEVNHLSMEGLLVRGEKTPHTVIRYFEDGEREEIPLYGADHYKGMETVPADLKPYFETAKGIYIFKNSREDFWEEILDYKKTSLTKLMWEIGADAAFAENKKQVSKIASSVDIFSVNMSESKKLLDTEDREKIIRTYQSWGIPLVFLRDGANGALMITPDSVQAVPSQKKVTVVDPTGGGNSSSGAVLYGWCEGYSPAECGIMGSLSAAMCISQYGVPKEITDTMRKDAQRLLSVQGKGYVK